VSPSNEERILLVLDRIEGKQEEQSRELSEVKGRVIALDAAHRSTIQVCRATHKRVDERLQDLEEEQETTGLHEREQMQHEIDAYRASKSHWVRYAVAVLGTLLTGGVVALITYALTHR
jgi:YesN/AraC family two-component response regulator